MIEIIKSMTCDKCGKGSDYTLSLPDDVGNLHAMPPGWHKQLVMSLNEFGHPVYGQQELCSECYNKKQGKKHDWKKDANNDSV